MSPDKLGFLKGYPIYADFTDQDLAILEPLAEMKSFGDVEFLFRENDPTDAVYIVRTGAVKIFAKGPDGQDLTVGLAEAGHPLGEAAFVDGGPRTASARTTTRTTIASFPVTSLKDLEGQHPEVAVKLVKILLTFLSERLRETTKRLFAVR